MSLKTLIDDNRTAVEADPAQAAAAFSVTGQLVGTTEVAIPRAATSSPSMSRPCSAALIWARTRSSTR